MTTRKNYIFTNRYIPPRRPIDLKWFQWDLDTWYTEIKYWEATDDPDYYFKNVKFINFGRIYRHIHKSKLQKPIQEYQRISKGNFKNYSILLKGWHDTFCTKIWPWQYFFLTRTWTVHISLKIMDFLQWKKGLRIRKNRLLTIENH